MTIDLEWLRTFKAIYECGTLTSAAENLFISQPGVSLHLNSLEGFTGYKLFDRSAKRMVPTERGKALYNFILEPLDKLQTVEQLFGKSSQAEQPTISLGMCFETFQYTLEEHISKLPFNLIIKFGEYPQMLHDLDKGVLDLIVTPHRGEQKNLEYQAFSKERIVMVCGSKLDSRPFQKAIKENKLKEAAGWLKKQTWYSTAADMEHLKRFWQTNFKYHIDFKPNYIVPNISSIVRCLRNEKGVTVIPDFLCREEMRSGELKLLWEGSNVIENTLYFGTRKKTIYTNEVNQIKKIFTQRMA
ncbi:LysR family transcriptional regulator [Chitinophaga sp. YIM B06452]|uniref:LysR family transcriptional regulator n=1 Tax=Chitinophaga sp. YIM B06452 TaxID=3082158 RepID=UPI0031FECE0E